jgi:hypothetical protein
VLKGGGGDAEGLMVKFKKNSEQQKH